MHIHIYISICTCKHIQVQIDICTYTHITTHLDRYIYSYMYVHTHTYTLRNIHANMPFFEGLAGRGVAKFLLIQAIKLV